jgi:hypothetical protein
MPFLLTSVLMIIPEKILLDVLSFPELIDVSPFCQHAAFGKATLETLKSMLFIV